MDPSHNIMVCRVCLAMDVKLYNITKHNLNIVYEQVTGIEISSEDKLPQELCPECVTKLSTAYTFIKKALITQGLLADKISDSGYITLGDIKTINKDHEELLPTNEFNIDVTEDINTDSIVMHENKDESKIKEDLKVEYEPVPDIEQLAKENYINEELQIKCEPEYALTIEEVADDSYVFTYTETDDIDILANTIQRVGEDRSQSGNKEKKKQVTKSKELLKCADCEFKTFYKSLLKLHINSKHTKNGMLNCSYCSYTTYYRNHLKLHENAKHTKKTVFTCQYCDFESYRKQYLADHVNAVHTKTTSFNCTQCSFTTYYKRLLNKHVKVKHS